MKERQSSSAYNNERGEGGRGEKGKNIRDMLIEFNSFIHTSTTCSLRNWLAQATHTYHYYMYIVTF